MRKGRLTDEGWPWPIAGDNWYFEAHLSATLLKTSQTKSSSVFSFLAFRKSATSNVGDQKHCISRRFTALCLFHPTAFFLQQESAGPSLLSLTPRVTLRTRVRCSRVYASLLGAKPSRNSVKNAWNMPGSLPGVRLFEWGSWSMYIHSSAAVVQH